MAAIGGFRSDQAITRKTDGNFGNVSAGVLFSKVACQRKRWQTDQEYGFQYHIMILQLLRKNNPI